MNLPAPSTKYLGALAPRGPGGDPRAPWELPDAEGLGVPSSGYPAIASAPAGCQLPLGTPSRDGGASPQCLLLYTSFSRPNVSNLKQCKSESSKKHGGQSATAKFQACLKVHSSLRPARDKPSDGLLSESIHSTHKRARLCSSNHCTAWTSFATSG